MIVEKRNVVRFELLMDAGFGAQKAGDILIRAFARTNREVYIEPIIPAEISPPARTRPALSGALIRVASFNLTNIGNNTDVMLASHEIVLDRRMDDEEYNPKCIVLLDIGDKKLNEETYEQVCKRVTQQGLSLYTFDITDKAKALIKGLNGKGKNMYYMGMLGKVYNVPEEVVVNEIKLMFGAKLKEETLNQNIEIFHEGYVFAASNIHLSIEVENFKVSKSQKILIDGNSALSMGIIDAGIKLVSGYPITPASSILHTLAKVFPSYGGLVHQAEDEIAAIGTAIGAYYGGTPALTCTSGPGLSLKQEFIGYAAAAENPVIIIDVQRSGPSTGMPTKTEQSDLLAVLYGSHGDAPKVVISVSDIIDCLYAPHLARYLTEKLRNPVFIMSDFQTANSYKVLDVPKLAELTDSNDIPDFILDRFGLNRLPEVIEMVRTEQADPGVPEKMRRITGLNTDKTGKVNYFAKANQRSHAVRNEKIHHVHRALKKPELIGGREEGDLLIIGWGSTRGAIEEAVLSCQKKGLAVGGICFKIVYPLPLMLKDIFSKFKKVITVELAYGDNYKRTPLAMFLRSRTLIDVEPILSEATGRPISPLRISTKAMEILNGGH
jgi:2-oxoglutarate ferredoxin oxidoreductase subunit alpha